MPPFGGQGANAGITDVLNLAPEQTNFGEELTLRPILHDTKTAKDEWVWLQLHSMHIERSVPKIQRLISGSSNGYYPQYLGL